MFMKIKILHFIMAMLIMALSYAGACKLKRVKLINSTKGIIIQLEFKGVKENFKYKTKVNPHDEYFLLTYSIPDCESSVKKLPMLEYPVMHSEVISGKESNDRYLNVNFYLKNKPPISHSRKKKKIISTLSVLETFPDEAPKILNSISTNSKASNTVTLKFNFNDIPNIKQGFMNKKRDAAIFVFPNTALASALVKPRMSFIKSFKVQEGITFGGVPFTKAVIKSDNQLFYTESPEANIYIVELYGQEKNRRELRVNQSSSYAPKKADIEFDAEEYERQQKNYSAGNTSKTILTWSLGGLLIGGGGYYVWDKYINKKGSGGEGLQSIPLIDESVFPP